MSDKKRKLTPEVIQTNKKQKTGNQHDKKKKIDATAKATTKGESKKKPQNSKSEAIKKDNNTEKKKVDSNWERLSVCIYLAEEDKT